MGKVSHNHLDFFGLYHMDKSKFCFMTHDIVKMFLNDIANTDRYQKEKLMKSSLYKKVLSYFPSEISCKPSDFNGYVWLPLNEVLDEVDERIETDKSSNLEKEILSVLSWSIAVGIKSYYKKIASKESCLSIQLDQISTNVVRRHFRETIKGKKWQRKLSSSKVKDDFIFVLSINRKKLNKKGKRTDRLIKSYS